MANEKGSKKEGGEVFPSDDDFLRIGFILTYLETDIPAPLDKMLALQYARELRTGMITIVVLRKIRDKWKK